MRSPVTKLIIETDNNWTRERIKIAIDTETHVLRKTVEKIRNKITEFEKKYGSLDRKKLYGKIGDMELIEWEGEIETLQRVERKLKSLYEADVLFRYDNAPDPSARNLTSFPHHKHLRSGGIAESHPISLTNVLEEIESIDGREED